MSTGYESGGFGLNQLDGTITERARLAGSIAAVVSRHQQLLLDARPPRAEVAIVFNPLAHFVGGRQRATPYGGPQGEVAGIERDSLLGAHRALFGRNVPIDYIHINHLSDEKLRQYRLVIFPYPLMMPEASARLFRDYVRGGGALVTEARLGWNNERGAAAEQIPGLGLAEVVGAREAGIETAPNGRTELRWTSTEIPGVRPGDRLRARWYQETLEPLGPQARVVAQFENGSAAAVLSMYGKGKTLMLGSYVSAAYQSTPTPEAERFYAGLLTWAGVTQPVSVSGAPLEVRALAAGNDVVLFVFNHGPEKAAAAVSIAMPAGNYTATDILVDRSVALTREEHAVRFNVSLDRDGVQVLRLERK
jgi:beta-galactosidase